MARRRQYGEDLTVAEWHRNTLPQLYRRSGHRLDMADRDWTEFCAYCKEPLCIWEEVVDRGQDLTDKATTVTKRLAEKAGLPAWLVAARIDRPADVQARIDDLNSQVRHLEALHPITSFTIRRIWPALTPFIRLDPAEFAKEIFTLHREHHATCPGAQHNHPVVHRSALREAIEASAVICPLQERLL